MLSDDQWIFRGIIPVRCYFRSSKLFKPKSSSQSVCVVVINWVGLYQRNYFSPQPYLLLFNTEVFQASQSEIFKTHTHTVSYTHAELFTHAVPHD